MDGERSRSNSTASFVSLCSENDLPEIFPQKKRVSKHMLDWSELMAYSSCMRSSQERVEPDAVTYFSCSFTLVYSIVVIYFLFI